MELQFLLGILGLILGSVITYYFVKAKFNKPIIELESQIDNEILNHNETRQYFTEEKHKRENLIEEIKNEHSEQVKYKTLFEEKEKQYKDIKALYENKINELTNLNSINAKLSVKYDEVQKSFDEQKKFVSDANQALERAFRSLSADALKNNNESFLELAVNVFDSHIKDSESELEKRQQAIDSMVQPLKESLTNFNGKIQETARLDAYSEIKVLLGNMQGMTEKLEKGTSTLVTALKNSHARGGYGEIGLRRVVEFAGMNDYCDFEEQGAVSNEEDTLKPDMIVKLPGQHEIIVDAKVPLSSYIQAFETNDEQEKTNLLNKHAIEVRDHLKKLCEESYRNQFDDVPDFVVMYFQIESSFGAALEFDRSLIEDGIDNNIILATPTTLITMLRTIAFSWQQVKIADNIYQIRDAGVELYNRVTNLIKHISNVGTDLNSAVQNYNKVVGSLESRFIPQAKKLKEIGGTIMEKEIPGIQPIEISQRSVNEMSIENVEHNDLN